MNLQSLLMLNLLLGIKLLMLELSESHIFVGLLICCMLLEFLLSSQQLFFLLRLLNLLLFRFLLQLCFFHVDVNFKHSVKLATS